MCTEGSSTIGGYFSKFPNKSTRELQGGTGLNKGQNEGKEHVKGRQRGGHQGTSNNSGLVENAVGFGG